MKTQQKKHQPLIEDNIDIKEDTIGWDQTLQNENTAGRKITQNKDCFFWKKHLKGFKHFEINKTQWRLRPQMPMILDISKQTYLNFTSTKMDDSNK